MKKFAFISDLIFTFLAGFLISLCLFRFLRLSLLIAVILALLCGTLITASVGAILRAKRKNLRLKKSDETEKEKLLFHFAMLNDGALTEFFRAFFTEKTDWGEMKKRTLLQLASDGKILFLSFRLAPVCPDEILKMARIKTHKDKILLCAQIQEDALLLCHRFSIAVKTGNEVYSLLKTANALPEKYLGEENPNIRHKKKFRLWFSRRNAKRFLVCGGFILLSSLLTPFFYYYLLLACVLLFVAIFVRIFGYEN